MNTEEFDLSMDDMGLDEIVESLEAEEGNTPTNSTPTPEGTPSPEEAPEDDLGLDFEEPNVTTPHQSTPNSSTSSANNSISAMLGAFKSDGVLPDIEDSFIAAAQSIEDIAFAIERQVEARLNSTTKRVETLLSAGYEPTEIVKYEKHIEWLDSISEDDLSNDDENTVELRKSLIKQDFINKGFSEERAEKEVNKSFSNGTDIEDALTALEDTRTNTKAYYDKLTQEAENVVKEEQKRKAKFATDFKKKVETTESFADLKFTNMQKNALISNILKPSIKQDNGTVLTPLQAYINENPIDAQYYLGVLYTLTDGFKNIDSLFSKQVQSKTNKQLKALESVLASGPSFQASNTPLYKESTKAGFTIDV